MSMSFALPVIAILAVLVIGAVIAMVAVYLSQRKRD
jgi:hypothetical protein